MKLKNPLISISALGRLGDTVYRRTISGISPTLKPTHADRKSFYQLSWRTMFEKAVAMWHELSSAEKIEWESLARPHHMTGYAYFLSQALKPNPGLYLPLAGGIMQGAINMASYQIVDLPDPANPQEPVTLAYATSNILPYLCKEGARVYNTANISIPHVTLTTLTFDSERYDTDSIHSLVSNTSRLTCKTSGKYLITGDIYWQGNAIGNRRFDILLNGATIIGQVRTLPGQAIIFTHIVTTVYHLNVGDYVELQCYQNSGIALNVLVGANYSPEFMMQRVGS